MKHIVALLFALIFPITVFSAPSAICRCQPNQSCWPNSQKWAGFAKQLTGKLVQPQSPLASCQKNRTDEDCSAALNNVKNPFYLESTPGGTQTQRWEHAWHAQASEYAVEAENTADIVAAINFARTHNLRLVIKGTGHDYLGRSSAPKSLLIWTHKMRNVKFLQSFVPEGAPKATKGVSAITVSAGTRWLDAYDLATTKHNQYVQGGGCTSVGAAGGFTQGGGFGSFSKKFGTGAAGILQVEVVTAEGKTLIANRYQHQDLFWAICGGGGGTFGVVTQMTLMTHDLPKHFGSVRGKITAKTDDDYKKLIEKMLIFYRDNLNNEHWGEQLYFNSDRTIAINMKSNGLSKQETEKAWLSLKTWVNQFPKRYTMKLDVVSIPARKMWDYRFYEENYPNSIVRNPQKGAPKEEFWWKGNSSEVYLYIYAHQTRWIPIQLFAKDHLQQLTDAFFRASQLHAVSLHFNKGLSGASADAIKRGRETATNPAVYDAVGLVIMFGGSNEVFQGIAGKEPTRQIVKKDIDQIKRAMEYITEITPNAGTYTNESDYFQKNWQQDFWGVNYKRLLEIKQKYDPNGLFYCHQCVGSEYWNDSGMCRLD